MGSDPRDYKLDLTGQPPASPSPSPDATRTPAPPGAAGRPYVSVHFACCSVYLRIYRSPDGLHYRGRCPRCGVAVNFVVGDGGTDARTFVVR